MADRIGNARVFRDRRVRVVRNARILVQHDILRHAPEADSAEDERFGLGREIDALRIAAAFDVEDALFRPPVLVVADELAAVHGGKRGLARS